MAWFQWQITRMEVPKNLLELQNFIFEEWWALDDSMISNLCHSIHNRVHLCIQAQGNQIEY